MKRENVLWAAYGFLLGAVVSVSIARSYFGYTIADLKNLLVDVIGRFLMLVLEFVPFAVIGLVVILFVAVMLSYQVKIIRRKKKVRRLL